MRRKKSVKEKLLISFTAFSLITILCLFILEVRCLDDIYRSMKLRTVNIATERINGMERSEIPEYLLKISGEDDVCSSVYDKNLRLIGSEHAGGKCVVHNLSHESVAKIYKLTSGFDKKSFDSYLPADEIVRVIDRNSRFGYFLPDFFSLNNQSTGEENAYDCIMHCQIEKDADGNEIFIMLSTALMPLDATRKTIVFVLMSATVALLGISALFAFFISKNITDPIVKLNRAAEKLSRGEFVKPKFYGYKEVDEFADTLSSAAAEIGKADKFRKELMANVSHDLRTPLTLISGYAEVMRDLPGENTPENLQTIIDETERLTGLVNDMLDISKLEAGMSALNVSEFSLTELVSEIVSRYEKLNLDTKVSFLHDGDVRISGDELKISQVVYNLINNAVNYCGEDKLVLVGQKTENGFVRISVVDHGEGIPKEKLEYIWERYYKADKDHKRSTVGTGLGLSIVRSVLELHGAKYGVESGEGEGSTFWFEFPVLPEKSVEN